MKSKRFDKGMKIRREVSGASRDDTVMENLDEVTRPIHTLVTEYCWGEVWSRPGLTRKERSLITLGILAANNRPNELKIHINAALNNGMTQDEIVECFLQVMIYCGVPAGLEGTNLAKQVFDERCKTSTF